MVLRIEKGLSEFLRRYPGLRNFIKLNYQRLMYAALRLSSGTGRYVSPYEIESTAGGGGEYFFGYYDKSPWDAGGRYLLTMKVPFSDRHPAGERALLGVVDTLAGNTFTPLQETKTWNLQQGCMLQWLGPDFRERIIYNDLQDGKYVSIIYDIARGKERVINHPVYSVSSDGRQALSLNFSRLQRLRPGYGYSSLEDRTAGELSPADDGIYLVDLEENTARLTISLAEIVELDRKMTMAGSEHRFNHLDINPGGSRFSFLHRWQHKGEVYSRLYTANMDGSEIYCLADDQMVSHSCWRDDRHLLAWARKKGVGDRYFLFRDRTEQSEIIGNGILTEDGHPSYSPDKRYLLTDTYPDRSRYRSLIVFDTETGQSHELGRFFATFKYTGEVRCDLHPRWSRDGRMISFDSVHEGKRKQYFIKNPLF